MKFIRQLLSIQLVVVKETATRPGALRTISEVTAPTLVHAASFTIESRRTQSAHTSKSS